MSRRLLLAIVIAASAASLSREASAESTKPRAVPVVTDTFTQAGDLRWIVLASRADGEEAIGIARGYVAEFPKVQVLQSQNGRYAVVIGPETVQTPADQFRRTFAEAHAQLPKDVFLSRGENFTARAWQYAGGPIAQVSAPPAGTARSGALTVSLTPQTAKGGEASFAAEGREDDKVVFKMSSGTDDIPMSAQIALVRLEGPTPQVVFGYFTGGAHCCMASSLVTRTANGTWMTVSLGNLDGDSGPAFEDLDGDGTSEMLSGDNGFLYKFDSYAASSMPARIEKLIGGKIVDVTHRPEYLRYHRQVLAAMEDQASKETWRSNGFLAGWVAQKTLVGEGDEALARAMKLYDRTSDWALSECTVPEGRNGCPESKTRKLTFPVALRKFLKDKGYR